MVGGGFQLKEDMQEKHAAKEFGLTVGTHSQLGCEGFMDNVLLFCTWVVDGTTFFMMAN